MKKLLSFILILSLTAALCGSASASAGDRILFHQDANSGGTEESIEACFPMDGQVVCISNQQGMTRIFAFDPETGERTDYDTTELEEFLSPSAENTEFFSEEEDEDEDEDEEYGFHSISRTVNLWFARSGGIRAAVTEYEYSGESEKMTGGFVYSLELKDGKAALIRDGDLKLNWDPMTEDYGGGYRGTRYVERSLCSGDTLYILADNNEGGCSLLSYDLKTGRAEEREAGRAEGLIAGKDGKLLLTVYQVETMRSMLKELDPATGNEKTITETELGRDSMALLQYDAARDILYYSLGGELYAAPGCDPEQAVSVNECPQTMYSCRAEFLTQDRLVIWNSSNIITRSLDPAARAKVRLTVKNYYTAPVLDRAYYAFLNDHGEVELAVSSQGNTDDILTAMMNRDAGTDVYILNTPMDAYSAVYNRGYMADLSSSTKLTEIAAKMYPNLTAPLMKDGKLVAVPLSIAGNAFGYNPKALREAGMTEEDLPKTWNEFYDFMEELPEKLAGKKISAFGSWMTPDSLKQSLFALMLMSYQDYMMEKGDEFAFCSKTLLDACARLDGMDTEKLGLRENEQDSMNMIDYGESLELFSYGTNLCLSDYGDGSMPMLLGFDEREPAATAEMTVAFVNPYSAHLPEALLYLETLTECWRNAEKANFLPGEGEPERYSFYVEWLDSEKEYLEEMKAELAELEKDEDEDTKELTERIREAEEQLKQIDEQSWLISPERLAAYQQTAPRIIPQTYSILYHLRTDDEGFMKMLRNYMEGSATAEQLLAELDRSIQMERLEGN